MAQLPYTQAVQRFRENDERFDQFLNDTLGTGIWVTSGGQSKETLPHLLVRITDEINGAISGVFAARDQAAASASAAQAYATTVASQAGTVASQASTVNTQYNAVNSAALEVEADRAQVAANTANVAANTVQVANDRAAVEAAASQITGGVVDLTYSASLDWDMNDGYMFRVTLTGDTELQLPANLKPGTHIMYVYQDAIGGHIMTFQTGYRAPRGLLPVLSTIPDGVDILTFVSDGVKVDVNIQANMLEG